MEKSELIKKIEAMSLEELWTYRSSAKVASRLVDIIGISLILCIIFFYSTLTLVVGGIFVYTVAQIGATIGYVVNFIEERIVNLIDK